MSDHALEIDPAVFGGRKAPEPTRKTRSAKSRAVMSAEFIDPETGEPYRRRSSTEATGAGIFEIPARYRKAGWDYQWEAVKVLNEPVDASVHANLKDNGWRAVQGQEMPDLMPPGDFNGKPVERGGQILYKRPKYLSDQARDELQAKADQQMHDKFASAQMTPAGTAPRHLNKVQTNVEALPDDLRQQYESEIEEI